MSGMRRPLTLLSTAALAVVPLTACGENYDPCWIDAETAASLFSTTSISQAINTEEATVQTSGYEPITEAEPLGDTGCAYEFGALGLAPDISVVLHRVPIRDQEQLVEEELARPFEEYLTEAEQDSDSRVFVEEWRDVTIVYSKDTAKTILDGHYWWARYTSDSSMRADRGADAQPLMRYVAGSRAGTDLEGYEAWLEEEAALMAAGAEAAAAERAESDYAEGYAAGLVDGEYEAVHGYPPQHYHRGLSDRSEDWLRGFEEGKAEALAAAPPLSAPEQEELAVDWEDEYWDLFDNTQGPFDHLDSGGQEHDFADDPYDDGYLQGYQDGHWDGEDGYDYTLNSAIWNNYSSAADRQDFDSGYAEGYREGYRDGWLGAGHPESDLPEEAR